MPRRRDDWLTRIKTVELEYAIAQSAMSRLKEAAERDPTIVPRNWMREIPGVAERLEGTYLIRLFAEFEAGLRQFWRTEKTTNPPMESLINGIRRMGRIPAKLTDRVHEVRAFRNALVHDREGESPRISLKEARAHLCKFFSWLPPEWP
ncbi:MAG: hypothetical protein ABS79_00305 [Planctomycetes bacterium SCN 63-9]|nr:MAG: hypothetical protein ABS79_00305 [Planctomycetes bacterium SCN 63-9]